MNNSYQSVNMSYQPTANYTAFSGSTPGAILTNGHIDSIEVVPMIVDAYKSFNRVFSPSRADIESYLKVLDRNGDGRVTIQDLEDLCNKYLTGR
jgi:hypothetical protein